MRKALTDDAQGMRRRATERFLGLVAVAALTLVGCGATTPARTTTSSSSPPPTTGPAPSTTPTSAGSTTVRVYFMRTDKLAVATRTVPATSAVATAALRQLLAGPTSAEAAGGLATAIPAGTGLRGIAIAKGVATVDLTAGYASGGGSLSMLSRLAQVTYTLTQFPTITGVVFRLDGSPVTVFGGEGVVLDHPSTRADFESVTPAILVESPTPGSYVSSPLRVRGTANVFEAAFQAELVDHAGRLIGSWPIQATAGTGTRGDFDTELRFTAPAGGATLTLYDLSAKDGSRQDAVSVPVQIR